MAEIIIITAFIFFAVLTIVILRKPSQPKQRTSKEIMEEQYKQFLAEKAMLKNPEVVKIEVNQEPEFKPHFKAGSKEIKCMPTTTRPKAFLETKKNNRKSKIKI